MPNPACPGVTRLALAIAALAAGLSLALSASPGSAAPSDPEAASRAIISGKLAGSPGAAVFRANCAACHDTGINRAPQTIILRNMPPRAILRALTEGSMRAQAAHLDDEQKRSVSEYLSERKLTDAEEDVPLRMCSAGRAGFDRDEPPVHAGWGFDPRSSHSVSAQQAGIGPANVGSLKLKWAFAFANSSRVRSQPSLAGGALFTGSQDGRVYALDRETGCVRWTFDAAAEVRTTVVVEDWDAGDESADPLAFFGDLAGNAYAVKAFTGEPVWQRRMDEHPAAVITASPALHEGTLIVPVSSLEEASAAAPSYQCCTFRGSVAALDAHTGEEKWRTFMVPRAEPQESGADGGTAYGPSGIAMWNPPSIDVKRGLAYLATGDNYSEPATELSDAIVALDLETGAIRWHYQATQGDAWNVACVFGGGNCPEDEGPDFDFGAGTILAETAQGRELVLAGQKSGIAYAIDPDTGELVWKSRVGRGGLAGGILFGMAVSGERLFVPVSDMGPLQGNDFPASPGLYGLDLATGDIVWSAPSKDGCADGRPSCNPGLGGAITATSELVFAGADDGWLRIYDAADGTVVWSQDLVRDFETVNGVAGRGGPVSGGAAPVVHDGQLIVASGYGFASKMPGNVLLVFEAE